MLLLRAHGATFRLRSLGAARADLLSFGPEIEVLEPPALREWMGALARKMAASYPRVT